MCSVCSLSLCSSIKPSFLKLCLSYQHPLRDYSLLAPSLQQIIKCLFALCPLIKEWLPGLNLHLLSFPRALDWAVCGHSTEMNHVYLKLIRSQATHPSLAKDTHLHALLMKNSSSSYLRAQDSNTVCVPDASLYPSTWCTSHFSHCRNKA